MSKVFETLLEELTPVALDMLNEALAEVVSKGPEEAKSEITEMARQTGIAAAARKGYRRS